MNAAAIAPSPPFAALIFDCDGTLADTLSVHYQAWVAALRQFGSGMDQAWYARHTGVSTVDLVALLNTTFGYRLEVAAVKAEKHRHFADLVHLIQPIMPVVAVVQAYEGKVPMAIASGGTRQVVHRTLQAIGVAAKMQTVLTIEDVAQGKPNPDLFLLAAQQLRVNPGDCVVYEDSEVGLEAAQRAGMRAIDVRPAVKRWIQARGAHDGSNRGAIAPTGNAQPQFIHPPNCGAPS
ncbi:MAG: HAD family phosphatase [Kaiparowitsia implicata GSE-PSE-MK54-09C]|jgi:HAD superfamily hydrolase (TIGR01509 family)|nr:HAD family phosphatase [Kaiparowitsia implicata GSE-PSE-MK54-09C]